MLYFWRRSSQVLPFPLAARDIARENVAVASCDQGNGNDRFASVPVLPVRSMPFPDGAVEYGPFRVPDAEKVALVGPTDTRFPWAFAQLLRDRPQIALVEMVHCPGTDQGRANLRFG